jgi:hypothetical protein
MLLRDIWDLFSMVQFDPINQMILLTMIPLSSTHCVNSFIFVYKLKGIEGTVSVKHIDQSFICNCHCVEENTKTIFRLT